MKMQEDIAVQDEMSMRVRDLCLSRRPSNVFAKAGIDTVGQLIDLTAGDLMRFKGFGTTCLNEVRGKLSERGFKLKGD